jgi:hypothetical protein
MNIDEIRKSILGQVQKIGSEFQTRAQTITPMAQNAVKYAPQAIQAASNPFGFGVQQLARHPQPLSTVGKIYQKMPQVQNSPTLGAAVYNFGVAQPIQSYGRTLQAIGDKTLYKQGIGRGIEDTLNLGGPIVSKAAPAVRLLANKAPVVNEALGQAGKIKLGPKIKLKGQTLELISEAIGMKPQGGSGVVAPKKAGMFQQAFNRARNVIEKQGPAGKELAGKIHQTREIAEISAGKWVSQMPTARKLSQDEFDNFVDVAEGKGQPINDAVLKAFKEWDSVRTQIADSADADDVLINRRSNYFPHRFDPKMFEGDNFVKAVEALVTSGQASSTDEAAKLLRYAKDIYRNRRHGNLEVERLVNIPGWERTKEALFGYIESASNRVAQVNQLGKDDEIAMQLINRVGQEGGDASTVKSLFDISVGAKQHGELQSKISNALRGYNAVTKLGLGAITNVGQNVNTASVTGIIRTLTNAPKAAMSKEAKNFALEAGITLDGVLNDLKDGAGFGGKVFGKIGAPGFNTVEKFNRTLAAIAGRDYARFLAKRGDVNALAKMGIKLTGNKLTPQQEIQAARNIVQRTQFKVDPQDLPGWASSPWGKVVAQFRTFSYNQSAFAWKEMLEPALKGNVAPLARFLAVGGPVGLGITTTQNILRNRKDEENPLKRGMQSYQKVGGLGLADSIATGLFPMNGKYLDPNRATTMAIGTLAGPTFGTIAEGYGALAGAVQGKPDNLERFALKQIPLVGSTLQNTMLPYKSADGDLNRRVDFGVNSASASDTNLPIAEEYDATGLTPIEKSKIDDEISKLNAKEKQIIAQNGIFGMGGKSDEEKNNELVQLDAQREL